MDIYTPAPPLTPDICLHLLPPTSQTPSPHSPLTSVSTSSLQRLRHPPPIHPSRLSPPPPSSVSDTLPPFTPHVCLHLLPPASQTPSPHSPLTSVSTSSLQRLRHPPPHSPLTSVSTSSLQRLRHPPPLTPHVCLHLLPPASQTPSPTHPSRLSPPPPSNVSDTLSPLTPHVCLHLLPPTSQTPSPHSPLTSVSTSSLQRLRHPPPTHPSRLSPPPPSNSDTLSPLTPHDTLSPLTPHVCLHLLPPTSQTPSPHSPLTSVSTSSLQRLRHPCNTSNSSIETCFGDGRPSVFRSLSCGPRCCIGGVVAMVTSGGSWHFGGVPTGESVAMLEHNMTHSIAGGTGYKIILV